MSVPTSHHLTVSLFLLSSLVPMRAAAFHLEDSLRDGSVHGSPVGGSFGPEGWRVTDRTDRIWFAIPRLSEGSIEFTMTDLTMENLVVADNEMFAMYEAGYGMAEPIDYGDFRTNHYKVMLRIYGTEEPGRAGQQKLMWGMCPSGAPGRDDCGCGSFFEEPFGGDPEWDGSPERIRIEWGAGVTRMLRNGVEVHRIDWSGSGITFGPEELHFSLGTSRPDAVGSAALPVGMVFSDVVVDGIEGPLSTCDGPLAEDAGTPPSDASVDSDASGPARDGSTVGAGADAAADGGWVPTDGGTDDGSAAGPASRAVTGGCASTGPRAGGFDLAWLALAGLLLLRRR